VCGCRPPGLRACPALKLSQCFAAVVLPELPQLGQGISCLVNGFIPVARFLLYEPMRARGVIYYGHHSPASHWPFSVPCKLPFTGYPVMPAALFLTHLKFDYVGFHILCSSKHTYTHLPQRACTLVTKVSVLCAVLCFCCAVCCVLCAVPSRCPSRGPRPCHQA